ncbi:hypothetical protein BCR42DRAFT_454197 [Absidia repens]|uniref:Uncharacterized protein n=1 Tax=Absidia repens TaxID=90262 RepID=A0A1X2I7P9_9FUNG|nr:hypothetical protein BCR42DRAFT_454197 [Absidia repens]
MSDNVNKMNQSSALNDRAPAQMVGGMRVGQGNRRTSLTHASAQKSKEQDQEDKEEEEEEQMAEMDKRRQEQIRQENAMRTQQAARDMNISSNAGTHVHSRVNQAYQPRDLNH